MGESIVNIRKTSVSIVFLGLAIVAILNVLASFKILDWTGQSSHILTIVFALFLLSEVMFFNAIKNIKKGNIVDLLIVVIGTLALLIAGLNILNIQMDFFDPILGVLNVAIAISFIVEVFRKNK